MTTPAHGFGPGETEHVQLGAETYELVPQPLPFLKHELGPMFEQLTDIDVEKVGVGAFLTQNAHKILGVFIEDLMPLHVWEGYRSAEDFEHDQALAAGELEDEDAKPRYDRGYAKRVAPTGPQVRLAIKAAFKVNGLDVFGQLGKLVDPTVLQEFVTRFLLSQARRIETADSNGTSSLTSSSPSTPDSDPTTSGTTPDVEGQATEPSSA